MEQDLSWAGNKKEWRWDSQKLMKVTPSDCAERARALESNELEHQSGWTPY